MTGQIEEPFTDEEIEKLTEIVMNASHDQAYVDDVVRDVIAKKLRNEKRGKTI